MKNYKKAIKNGKIYPILLIATILALFGANLIKISIMNGDSFDAAPFSAETTLERLETPEKPAEIANTFSGAQAVAKSAPVARTIDFSAKIINVSDMNYGNGAYYNSNAIMHNTVYTRFYYAHNTGAFRNLSSLKVGDSFTLGGAKYEVKAVALFDYATTQSSMGNIARANYSGNQYDISMMTCAGSRNANLPNGTSDHRLIVYANRV